MLRLKKSEWAILAGLLFLSFVPCIGGLFRLIELMVGLEVMPMPENPRVRLAPVPVIIHLVGAIPYCILGIVQFLPSLRNAYPKWHRMSGRFLVAAGLLAALSGLWMTHFYYFPASMQGPLLYWVRFGVGFGMIASLCLGLSTVLKRRIAEHKAWMIRAYALGQGAGTQVITAIPWLIMVGEPSGLTRDILMTFSWVINILIAEAVIRRDRKIASRDTANFNSASFLQNETYQKT